MKWPRCRVWNNHLRGSKASKQAKTLKKIHKGSKQKAENALEESRRCGKTTSGKEAETQRNPGRLVASPSRFVTHASSVLSHSTCDVISSADIHKISGYAGSWDQWRHPRGWISGPFCAVNTQVAPPHPATVGPQPSSAPSARATRGNGLVFPLPRSHPRVYAQPHLLSFPPRRAALTAQNSCCLLPKTELITPTFVYPHLSFVSLFTLT